MLYLKAFRKIKYVWTNCKPHMQTFDTTKSSHTHTPHTFCSGMIISFFCFWFALSTIHVCMFELCVRACMPDRFSKQHLRFSCAVNVYMCLYFIWHCFIGKTRSICTWCIKHQLFIGINFSSWVSQQKKTTFFCFTFTRYLLIIIIVCGVADGNFDLAKPMINTCHTPFVGRLCVYSLSFLWNSFELNFVDNCFWHN